MQLSTKQTIRVIAVATTLSSISNCARGFTTSVASQQTTRLLTNRSVSSASWNKLARTRSSPFSSTTAMTMIFDRFFASLGGGGAFEAAIDYDSMPFPVPELAQLALEGTVPATIESNDSTKKIFHVATFAGGCFWGLELAYQRVPGVVHTAVGYTQGQEKRPNYDAVCAGATGHTEAVIVLYDPSKCSYEELLDVFFGRVDPLTVNGQGYDKGKQYRTGVYYHTAEQEAVARERFGKEQTQYTRPIATECNSAMPFWPAEEYHQQYLSKGGRFNQPQSTEKGYKDEIRCYG